MSDMPNPLAEYRLSDGMTLRFSESACNALRKFRQTGRRNEAGGILLGRILANDEIVIEKVTRPGALDRAGRYFFDRARGPAQRTVEREWKKSNGEIIYLGEWHSHPEDFPTPSSRDKEMIRNMFKDTRMEIDFLVELIIGLEDDWVGIQDEQGLRRILPS
jgi:integrative and conjugative element protein (TIGR02256 family)